MTVVPEEKTLRLLRELDAFFAERRTGGVLREGKTAYVARDEAAQYVAQPDEEDTIRRLDEERREILVELETLRNRRNYLSKEIGRTKDTAQREEMKEQVRQVNAEIDELEPRLTDVEVAIDTELAKNPNKIGPGFVDGEDETQNVIIHTVGEPRVFDFDPLAHWDLGTALGMIDFERGVKLSGSRFYVLNGAGAKLQRALIQWMLDFHLAQGYAEVYTPFVVKEQILYGAGQLPKFRDNLYHDVEDDLWLVPTAEVPVTNLYREEILDGAKLPIRHVAYTPCFRREKMSAGKDVRGIKRGHQFDKVEMYIFCVPEESDAELERLTAHAEETCAALGLAYRRKMLCTGDLGFAALKTYDVEVWAPGQKEWLEVSSCSNVGDFQARRAQVRFRRAPGTKPEFAHTLNGSGLGLPRTLIAVMENYQQKDGSIVVPEVLRPYVKMDVIK
jgi:seryl-tRNA synthetase